jgi:putative nucleotidyltransferase with HDIG domain
MDRKAEHKYQAIVDSLGQIPSLPAVVSELIKVINHPRSSADDAARYIEKDIGMAGKVLKLANSSYYGIPNAITNVNSAVVILGFNTVRSIVISASVIKLFPNKSHSAFDRVGFWKHSLETAIIARFLAKKFSFLGVDGENLFTAGLLHDIGKLVFDQVLEQQYQDVIEECQKKEAPMRRVESAQLGIHHGEIGRLLLERWALPESLVMAASGHHLDTEDPQTSEMVIAFADYLSHLRGSGCFENEPVPPLTPTLVSGLRISDSVADLQEAVQSDLDAAQDFFSLIAST